MSEYICDICSKTLTRSEIKFHTAATMHQAIRYGLNPWKTPGINMTISSGVGSVFGLNSDEQYRHWRQRVMTDTTDWGLCSDCTQAVSQVLGATPAPAKPYIQRDYGAVFKAALESTSPHVAAALTMFEAEISSDPDSAEKHFWIGAAYLTASGAEKSSAFLDRAIESFQRALQIEPKHKNSYAKLLGAYMSKGDDEAVRETAMQWAIIDPDLPAEARRWLREQEPTDQLQRGTVSEAPRRCLSKSSTSKRWWQLWR